MKIGKAVASAVAACAAISFAMPSQAQFVYYSNRATFTAANPGLTIDDFEAANTAGTVVVSGPQDRFTNNTAFKPGDIIPNLRITAVGTDPDQFYVNNGVYAPTKVLTTNYGADFARLDFFEGGTGAFGVDLGSNSTGGNYSIRIFGTGGLLDTRSVTSGFFGFSSVQNILKLELDAPTFETFDNVTIGVAGAPLVVPEPGAYATLAGIGIAGFGLARRRRKA